MDIVKSLKTAVKSKKVFMGYKQTLKCLKDGKAEYIVLSQNCPEKQREIIKKEAKDVPVYDFDGNNADLGILCGKPFFISSLVVIKEEANISSFV
ncbi:MAG TPA: 50S ribosomal protein L30e [Halobacteria archaeon]|jgi:large subunit ribosomal protein L30e|nr:50S ribosomal protein L30e [Halobacteria archaeon]HIH77698.1 50S ribosomal protein L30e [Halobacteria archaeon]